MAKRSKITDFNKFMFNELKMQIDTKDKAEITNLLNWSLSDFEKVKQGKKELSLKEINLLTKEYGINLDSIYNKHLDLKGNYNMAEIPSCNDDSKKK
jgi:hypothetical protein